MGKLFLGGGGSAEKSLALDTLFVKSLDEKPILYIPVAMVDPQRFPSCWEWFTGSFSKLGVPADRIVMWTDLEGKTLKDVQQFSAIYMGGGNTFHLLYLLRKTGFDKILKEYAAGGGIIYGGSAGAIVLGESILSAFGADKNIHQLTDLAGLGLVRGVSIRCHYKPQDDELILKLSKDADILAISEDAGAIVTDKILPVGALLLFTKESKQQFE